jgi:hypothetical protein
MNIIYSQSLPCDFSACFAEASYEFPLAMNFSHGKFKIKKPFLSSDLFGLLLLPSEDRMRLNKKNPSSIDEKLLSFFFESKIFTVVTESKTEALSGAGFGYLLILVGYKERCKGN